MRTKGSHELGGGGVLWSHRQGWVWFRMGIHWAASGLEMGPD